MKKFINILVLSVLLFTSQFLQANPAIYGKWKPTAVILNGDKTDVTSDFELISLEITDTTFSMYWKSGSDVEGVSAPYSLVGNLLITHTVASKDESYTEDLADFKLNSVSETELVLGTLPESVEGLSAIIFNKFQD